VQLFLFWFLRRKKMGKQRSHRGAAAKKGQPPTSSNAEMDVVLSTREQEAEEQFLRQCMQSTVDLTKIAHGREGYSVVVPLSRTRGLDQVSGRIVVQVVMVEGFPGITILGSDFAPLPLLPAWLAIWTLYEERFPAHAVEEPWREYLYELWQALKWACREELAVAIDRHRGIPARVRPVEQRNRTSFLCGGRLTQDQKMLH
jgi:hypothetical protein